MTKKTLLFEPQAHGRLQKSALYAVPIFSKVIALCAEYLIKSINAENLVQHTDDYIVHFWQMHFAHSFTKLYATGRENLKQHEPYIFMSNHESWMDIPAIFGAAPPSLRMVSKAGLMKVPVLGRAMQTGGFIAVDRQNRSKAIRQLEEAKKRLDEGISIWIAPEGTRSRDGSIGAFKKGGFYLAKQLKKPIVPVFIEGAAEVMPPDSIVINANRSITVHFCEPISSEELEILSTAAIVEKVRATIIQKRQECLNLPKEA